jgi:hypothetical protein
MPARWPAANMGCCGPCPLEKLSCPQSSSSSYPRYSIDNADPVTIYPRYSAVHRALPVPTPGTPSTTLVQCLYPRYSAVHSAGLIPTTAVLLAQLSSGLVQLYPQIWSSFDPMCSAIHRPGPVPTYTGTQLSMKLVLFLPKGLSCPQSWSSSYTQVLSCTQSWSFVMYSCRKTTAMKSYGFANR